MRSPAIEAAALALLLGACAGSEGEQASGLYGRLSQHDVALAATLLQDTLESAPDGASRTWTNPSTGDHGRVTPVRTWLSEGGYFCRNYEEELAIGGRTERFEHAACRDSAGRWIWLQAP